MNLGKQAAQFHMENWGLPVTFSGTSRRWYPSVGVASHKAVSAGSYKDLIPLDRSDRSGLPSLAEKYITLLSWPHNRDLQTGGPTLNKVHRANTNQ